MRLRSRALRRQSEDNSTSSRSASQTVAFQESNEATTSATFCSSTPSSSSQPLTSSLAFSTAIATSSVQPEQHQYQFHPQQQHQSQLHHQLVKQPQQHQQPHQHHHLHQYHQQQAHSRHHLQLHQLSEPPRKRSREQTTETSMIGGNGLTNDNANSSITNNPTQSSYNNNNQIATSTTTTTAAAASMQADKHVKLNFPSNTIGQQQTSSMSSHNAPSNVQAARDLGSATSSSALATAPSTAPPHTAATTASSFGASGAVSSAHGSSVNNIPSFAAVSMVTNDNDPDEIEMSRLQAILEARGVPPHLLGALGPRMQTLLHRTIGSSTSSKAHQLVQGIQAHGDEGQQLQSVMELCQLLVMGNEDTLAGFPIKLAVPNLIQLLNMEHNFEIMNHACRALTYMMESLPRSASVVVDAVPSFLEKLQSIQCMDVAEQSLTALEMLSRRHGRAILHAHGVSACLTYLDFFSINAQRSALAIAANCCQNITSDEFTYIRDSLITLSSHLTSTDKKSVESICLAFSRLVEHYQNEPQILMGVAGSNLLENLTQLLLASPSVISMHTFVMIIRMMALMCQSCPELAVRLLSSDIISTMRYLLVGQKSNKFSSSNQNKSNISEASVADSSSSSVLSTSISNKSFSKLNESVELLNRSPQELYEITSLIAELMPRLPSDGIFSIDAMLSRDINPSTDSDFFWQWRDDRGIWHRYNTADNKLIDSAHRAGDEEVSLIAMGRTYTIDFTTMQQINDETEVSRPIQRKVNYQIPPSGVSSASKVTNTIKTQIFDPRIQYIKSHPEVLAAFAQSLFGVLYEIYSSSAGPSVRHKCLYAFLRIIYYTPTESLKTLLKNHPVSSHIAAMLTSSDQRILVGAIQMASILMDRLPDVFSVYFRREGVMHQFGKLSKRTLPSRNTTFSLSPDSSFLTSHMSSGHQASDIKILPQSHQSKSKRSNAEHSTRGHKYSGNSSTLNDVLNSPSSSSALNTDSSNSSIYDSSLDLAIKQQRQSIDFNIDPVPLGLSPDSRSKSNLLSSTLASASSTYAPGANHGLLQSSELSQQPPLLQPQNVAPSRSIPPSSTPSNLNTRSRHWANVSSGFNSRHILANFHPRLSRWGNRGAANASSGHHSHSSSQPGASTSRGLPNNHYASCDNSTFSPSRSALIASSNKEKIKDWVTKQAHLFEDKFLSPSHEETTRKSPLKAVHPSQDSHPAMDTLNKLTKALEMLDSDTMIEALQQVKSAMSDGDISSFELIHSGLVHKLTKFLTSMETANNGQQREDRIRAFLSVFLGLPLDPLLLLLLNEQELRLDAGPLSTLVAKLNACVSQLEQFPVQLHDFVGAGSGNTRGTSALKFFNTHQLKCNLQRHPQCNDLRQWRGGPVKIDPLAVVQAIEKYLTIRGYSKIRDSADNSDDNNSDDDLDDSMNIITQPAGRHRLQLYVGDQVLPYNMTVYQAIRQFGSRALGGDVDSEVEDNDGQLVGHSNMWSETHTIYYRPYTETQAIPSQPATTSSNASQQVYILKRGLPSTSCQSRYCASDLRLNPIVQAPSDSQQSIPELNVSSQQLSSSGTSSTNQAQTSGRRQSARNSANSLYSSHHHRNPVVRKKVDDLWTEGKTPEVTSPVDSYLTPKLPNSVTVKDPSLDIITLLRAIYGLNRYWSWFYRDGLSFKTHQVINYSEFINTKLAAKATRQLQDPLVIMTGNLPQWLPQIAYSCPFLIPFETRQLLLYVACFDRDRALQRLLDTTPDLTTAEDRVTPRLDRRKKTISREDLFKQAEIILNELTNSKTVLEIQYENEVGTGLGPTLEFYALVSRELQSADLEMWRGEVVSATKSLIPQTEVSSNIKAASEDSAPLPSGSFVACPETEHIHCEDKYDSSMRGINNKSQSKESKYAKSSHSAKSKHHQHHQQTPPPHQQLEPPVVTKPVAEEKKKYIYAANGLFPLPIARNAKLGSVSKLRNRYKLLGRFMARALMDSRMIDISFSLPFYKWLLSLESTLDLSDMVDIDPTMARTLFSMKRIAQLYSVMLNNKQAQTDNKNVKVTTAKSLDKLRQQVGSGNVNMPKLEDIFANISPEVLTLDGCPIEDLNLDFTLPGHSSIELKKGGKDSITKLENLDQYVKLLRHWTLSEGIRRQIEAFRAGFESIIPLHHLKLFYPEELDSLFCGSGYQSWDVRMLMDACKTDHGFTHESIQIKYLFGILSSYNADEQRKFLQFITGSPRLPFGGLKSLTPPLTIVRKTLEPGQNPDHFLPSVMTCVNYLKLPEYSSCEIMREKLRLSGDEGRNFFHLS